MTLETYMALVEQNHVANDIEGCKVHEDDIDLSDIWTLRFHDPNDEDWTNKSYVRLADISTVQDYWKVHNAVKDKLKNGMFFLMREYIFPTWDDENHIEGGCLSIKVLKEHIVDYWEQLVCLMLGENLLVDEHANSWDVVSGISTSPKRYFCIVKIWLKDNEYGDKKFFKIPPKHYGEVIYRENLENIQKNNENVTPSDDKGGK
jgi:hypothetical protein